MTNENYVTNIRSPYELLGNIDWPQAERFEIPDLGPNDCVLVCAGFERRATEMLERVCSHYKANFTLGLVSYLPEEEENRLAEFYKISGHAGLKVRELVYDREKPLDMVQELGEYSNSFDRFYVDISGMSRLLIVQILVALVCNRAESVAIVYCEAGDYPPSQEEFKNDLQSGVSMPSPSYLSSGIFEVAAAAELSSIAMLGSPTRLIAFPSFDPSQLANLVQELQPTYTDIVHGVPPRRMQEWRREAIRQLNAGTLGELQAMTNYDASTLDYRETLRILVNIYSERSMFDRIVIAPTGSKMQAVAVGIFRAVLEDVQIVYPTPKTFTDPQRYTLGVRELHELKLPMANLLELTDLT
ncbi:MAG: hypothetical protein OXH45_03205 [Gammaproteobacteria bacterium]|nr:hypothetical protein [Gammaproteobacteria bacterium]